MNRNVSTTANALRRLWDNAVDTLPPDQLKWFDGLNEFAKMEAENISESLDALAVMFNSTEKSALPTESATAVMLWSLSYQIDTIAALIEIAGDAAHYRETERRPTSEVPPMHPHRR
ncbi:hypothetical protein [Methylosarcina fibrata]|uniref:hypothetical protein n=1 Tax=Methylosarcina fibrata TaxID=105972 RepID=UPI00035D9E12|nr:hypothetical protein [Methylosarcina fibrata]